MTLRSRTPDWGRRATVVAAVVCALLAPAVAQPRDKKPAPPAAATPATPPVGTATPTDKPAAGKKPGKEQNFNFEGLGLNGRNRSPQLLYFLERANEELERASLEKRSFVPHIVRSVEEETL